MIENLVNFVNLNINQYNTLHLKAFIVFKMIDKIKISATISLQKKLLMKTTHPNN